MKEKTQPAARSLAGAAFNYSFLYAVFFPCTGQDTKKDDSHGQGCPGRQTAPVCRKTNCAQGCRGPVIKKPLMGSA